jgi:hypothetical protein
MTGRPVDRGLVDRSGTRSGSSTRDESIDVGSEQTGAIIMLEPSFGLVDGRGNHYLKSSFSTALPEP